MTDQCSTSRSARPGRTSADPGSAVLTCSRGSEEVAEIAKLLLTLAARSLAPPERTGTGYRLRLPAAPDVEASLEEFVREDKDCCPFLDFSVTREAEALRLEVSGPEAASRLLDLCVEFARLGREGARIV
jgi:hypothetical protein